MLVGSTRGTFCMDSGTGTKQELWARLRQHQKWTNNDDLILTASHGSCYKLIFLQLLRSDAEGASEWRRQLV